MEAVSKNDVVTLSVTDISAEGQGVAKFGGLVVFAPFTAPGEVVEALILKVNKNHAFAKVLKIIKPSPERAEAGCPVYGKCGGCAFRHMSYDAELRAKLNIAASALKRIGGTDIKPCGIIPSTLISGYRNKAVLPFGGECGDVRLGFYAGRSHRLVPAEYCDLCPDIFASIQRKALGFLNARRIPAYGEETGKGILRHLYLRRGERSGEIMVCFVINGECLKDGDELAAMLAGEFPAVRGVLINTHTARGNANLGSGWSVLYGRDYIMDNICGLEMRISAGAFYQVNTSAAEELYGAAFDMADLEENETVLDLFCGAGAIGLFFAKKRPDINVTGVEIDGKAVADARENAKHNAVNNIRFVQADLDFSGNDISRLVSGFSAVIVDPPRKGLGNHTVSAIAAAHPRRIVYISCDPATLSRDISLLGKYGYTVIKSRAADLFPRTRHVEVIAVLKPADC
ncbi:MAG: 23S rRNA (uracil(1939)-C(5))-methyltransferase RlmD [Defluviitaleaceae bacterium]|nr:23S rRNA (uracil(1939)-C(5))-methyltransferase RlmD [Defluviitaleaceae bacterium]MCL2835518.1 23S rRNA (uracil(1939)-C(5))-methyltransferase RlmD [Defluviitaleaceae bacterium]